MENDFWLKQIHRELATKTTLDIPKYSLDERTLSNDEILIPQSSIDRVQLISAKDLQSNPDPVKSLGYAMALTDINSEYDELDAPRITTSWEYETKIDDSTLRMDLDRVIFSYPDPHYNGKDINKIRAYNSLYFILENNKNHFNNIQGTVYFGKDVAEWSQLVSTSSKNPLPSPEQYDFASENRKPEEEVQRAVNVIKHLTEK